MCDTNILDKVAYAWGLRVGPHLHNGFNTRKEALDYYRKHVLPEKPLDVVLVYTTQQYGEYKDAYRII